MVLSYKKHKYVKKMDRYPVSLGKNICHNIIVGILYDSMFIYLFSMFNHAYKFHDTNLTFPNILHKFIVVRLLGYTLDTLFHILLYFT